MPTSKSLTACAGNTCRTPNENITGLPQGELLLGFKITFGYRLGSGPSTRRDITARHCERLTLSTEAQASLCWANSLWPLLKETALQEGLPKSVPDPRWVLFPRQVGSHDGARYSSGHIFITHSCTLPYPVSCKFWKKTMDGTEADCL